MATEKLNAAQVLVSQNLDNSALELLISALLARTADLAGLDTPPSPADVGVWVYSEAVPGGFITHEEASLIMRAIGLGQAATIPRDLLVTLLEDVTSFVDVN